MSPSRSKSPGRWLLAGCLLVAASVVAATWMRRPPEPDVVIVVLDTLRPDHLGCYGYERDTSPNLDAFAAQSVVFTDCESASPWTAPAMISLVTSLHPEVHGVLRFPNPGRLNERVRTLPELLKARGYATAMFTEGGYAKAEFGLDQGVDVFPSNEGDADSHMSNMEHASRIEHNVDRALEWWSEQSGPRFMLFHTYEVHAPLRAPDEYVQLFHPGWVAEEQDRRLAEVFERYAAGGELTREDVMLALDHLHHCNPEFPEGFHLRASELDAFPEESGLNEETLAFVRDHYDAEIRYTDAQVRRLLEVVDENTVVVVVSDHGEAIGEHGKIGHGTTFHREQIGVALIVRAPGFEPRRVSQLVRSIDVMPTVLELTHARPPDLALQGESLVPLLAGERGGERWSFSHALSLDGYEQQRHSARDGHLRAVLDDEGAVRLYDLLADPAETVDLSPERAQAAERIAAEIRAQRERDRALAELVSGEVEAFELDEELRKQLEELGYIGE